MNSRREQLRSELSSKYVLFSCEGTAEAVIVQKLLEDDALVVPHDNVVLDFDTQKPYTRLRKAKDIESRFFGFDYPNGLLIARIVDVNPDKFVISKCYKDTVVYHDIITRQEIEVLILVSEGEYDEWYRHGKQKVKASDWCKQKLKMGRVKERVFLEDYWQQHDLVAAIHGYTHHLGSQKNAQFNLEDLLK